MIPANSGRWRVSYPRRTPYRRRPQMWVGTHQMVTQKSRSPIYTPWLDSSPPLSHRQEEEVSSPRLSVSSVQSNEVGSEASGGELGSSNGGDGGGGGRATRPANDRGRAVRFDSVVKLILVPSRLDLSNGLSDELWWNEEDYLQFRLGAIVEESAGVLLKALRNKRSRRVCLRADSMANPRGTKGLQRFEGRRGSVLPVQHQYQLKLHRSPSFPSRQQEPVTPPTSPVK